MACVRGLKLNVDFLHRKRNILDLPWVIKLNEKE
jgi:hypothetical protein